MSEQLKEIASKVAAETAIKVQWLLTVKREIRLHLSGSPLTSGRGYSVYGYYLTVAFVHMSNSHDVLTFKLAGEDRPVVVLFPTSDALELHRMALIEEGDLSAEKVLAVGYREINDFIERGNVVRWAAPLVRKDNQE